jgi:phage terminase large subunit GpA-like protein
MSCWKLHKKSILELIRQAITPPAQLNPWEWAEKHVQFSSRVSPIQGYYRTTSTPYVREPLEAFADPAVRSIALCWPAQSGKTTTELIMALYGVDNAPGDCLIVRPSLDMARSFSEAKVLPLIRDNGALAKHMTGDRYDLKKTEVILDRMTIFLQGANPNQLSSRSIKYLILDEVDKYEEYKDSGSEADLVSLAEERLKFYRDHVSIKTSTPTVPSGVIWVEFLNGDQRHFHTPCPKCAALFVMTWDLIKWPKDEVDPDRIRARTFLECPHCQAKIQEKQKRKMMLAGVWIAARPDCPKERRSYHLNELYSPITRWGDLVLKFKAAHEKAKVGDFGPLHNFVNSSLAEPWDPEDQKKRDPDSIRILAETRQEGKVPDAGVLGLAAAVDTQDLGFYFTVRAIGRDLESWQILSGYAERFEDVRGIVLDSTFPTVSGDAGYAVQVGLWDSGGHRTDEVYNFCRAHPIFRPSKGQRVMSRPWEITKIDRLPTTGAPIPGGLHLVRINTTYYKDLLAGKLSLAPDAPGAFHLHADPSDDYVKHMTAEYRNEKGIWICPKHRRNDFWDIEVMILCAADMVGMRFWESRQPKKTPRPGAGQAEEDLAKEREQLNPFLGRFANPFKKGERR